MLSGLKLNMNSEKIVLNGIKRKRDEYEENEESMSDNISEYDTEDDSEYDTEYDSEYDTEDEMEID